MGSLQVERWQLSPEVEWALLGLVFKSTLWSHILFPMLTILVILMAIAWKISGMWMWMRYIMVTICYMFTALNWISTGISNICCLHILFPFNNIKLQSPHSYTSGVILYDSLVYKCIFLHIVFIDKTVSVSYLKPFYCPQNLSCNDLLVLTCRECCVQSPGLLFTVVPGLVSASAAGCCWVSAWLLVVPW